MRNAVAAILMLLASAALAQSGMKGMDMKDMNHPGMDMKMEKGGKKSQATSHHATGTVKSVDADKGTVTIDHGPVSTMNWPAMSMAFKAKDKKAVQSLKPGQEIEFDFMQQGKDYVITRVK